MNPARPSSLHGFEADRVHAVALPIASAHGAEIVGIELKSEAGGWVLRVLVERLGSAEKKASTQEAAVDLDVCSRIARELSPALDVLDAIPHRYHLEVGSPGIERPLRGAADFARFAGHKARIKLHHAVAGQKVLVGAVGAPTEGRITVEDGGRTYTIALDDVAEARLVFDFGASTPRKKKRG